MKPNSNAVKAAIYEMGLLFNQQPTDERITAYAKALQNYSPNQIKFAFNSVILSGSAFFPSLAEILTHLKPMKPKSEDVAADMMEEIVRVAIEHGQYRTDRAYLALSDKTKEMLGDDRQIFMRICKSYESELPTIKAQLRNLLRARLELGESQQHNGKLLKLGLLKPAENAGMNKVEYSPEGA